MLALEEKEVFGDQYTEAIWQFPVTAEKGDARNCSNENGTL
jgi:hypothetical protein